MSEWSLSFDSRSLSEIARLYGFNLVLSPEFQAAMSKGADVIVEAAVANTWSTFMHPSGKLADSIHKIVDSPYEIQVGSALPYAHRREFSFKGPDALGRYFPNDPAAHYLETAMTDHNQEVLILLDGGAEAALSKIGGGL